MSPVTSVLITGANVGLGKESARQLALTPGVTKVILGCRNETKAIEAKKDLENSTGKDVFEVLVIDVSNLDSVKKAVENLKDPIDGLILNAGGVGGAVPSAMTDYGVTAITAVNVLGHVHLVDLLLEQKKLTGSVVFSGTEASRGVPTFGMKKPELQNGSVEEFSSILDGSFSKDDKTMEALYGPTKLVGTFWMSSMARKEPDMRFVTMSPGGTTGTSFATDMSTFQQMTFAVVLPIMKLFGKMHSLEDGAKRYVDALIDTENAYKSGVFYASEKGVTGKVVDQVVYLDKLHNESYQDNANVSIHKYIK